MAWIRDKAEGIAWLLAALGVCAALMLPLGCINSSTQKGDFRSDFIGFGFKAKEAEKYVRYVNPQTGEEFEMRAGASGPDTVTAFKEGMLMTSDLARTLGVPMIQSQHEQEMFRLQNPAPADPNAPDWNRIISDAINAAMLRPPVAPTP